MKRNRPSIIDLIEQEWSCPITNMPMEEPVITQDGHSYQKEKILQWFTKQQTSPKTGLRLTSINIIPNRILKNIIHRFDTEIKYQFNTMETQIEQLKKENTLVERRVKQLSDLNKKLKEQSSQKDKIILYLERFKQKQKRYIQQIAQLKKQCQSLSVKNEQYLKKITCKQGEIKKLADKKLKQKRQMVQKQKKQKKQQKSFLPYNEYLITLPVLYQQQKKLLDHSQCPIDMDFFLMHDWSHLVSLDLDYCGIDNVGFQKLANELELSKKLENLTVRMNQITHIKAQTLTKLKNLKIIVFSYIEKQIHSLDSETKILLQCFKRVHPQIVMEFEAEQNNNL